MPIKTVERKITETLWECDGNDCRTVVSSSNVTYEEWSKVQGRVFCYRCHCPECKLPYDYPPYVSLRIEGKCQRCHEKEQIDLATAYAETVGMVGATVVSHNVNSLVLEKDGERFVVSASSEGYDLAFLDVQLELERNDPR